MLFALLGEGKTGVPGAKPLRESGRDADPGILVGG